MKTIDARGLSCPQPVILLKKGMAEKDKEYECIVDSQTCVQNCSRYARSQGYDVTVKEDGSDFILKISK